MKEYILRIYEDIPASLTEEELEFIRDVVKSYLKLRDIDVKAVTLYENEEQLK
jgi:hypothetical protein